MAVYQNDELLMFIGMAMRPRQRVDAYRVRVMTSVLASQRLTLGLYLVR